MPQAIDIKIKNGAATPIDKTFTLLTPSSGDASIAEWALREGLMSKVFPRITSAARRTPSGRKSTWKLRLPSSFVDASSGLLKVGPSAEFNIEVSIPDEFPESMKDDFVAYVQNLSANALFKSAVRDGLPTT